MVKVIFVKMLITAIFGFGLFVGMSVATGVPVPSAAVISSGFSYVSWRINNGTATI